MKNTFMKIFNSINNPSQIGRIFYGLHMVEGVAEYKEKGKEPYRVLLNEATVKRMNSSFPGCPVYVGHEMNSDEQVAKEKAVGYVVESFFNKSDGRNWVKFVVFDDKGVNALQQGWKLSNCYKVKEMSSGGQWHGLSYDKEIMNGEYDHLAIVRNPRYEESIVLTPEEFKKYNEDKEAELYKLANANETKKEGEQPMFNLFTKKKLENSADLEATMVALPKCKKEMSLGDVLKNYDDLASAQPDPTAEVMANGDHKVQVGEEKMSVTELLNKYNALVKPANEPSEEEKAAAEKKANEEKAAKEDEEKKANEAKAQAEKDAAEKKANEEKAKKDEEEKKANALFFEDLDKAPLAPLKNETRIETTQTQVARGKSLYGSN